MRSTFSKKHQKRKCGKKNVGFRHPENYEIGQKMLLDGRYGKSSKVEIIVHA